ncbi:hypothetical protein GLOIN_2v1668671 [Rhizophagus irregularis DAOM 181602=DAOM 197198]|uniref:Uncharacterized protein n=1 Tax=Rhizophagus irregularis (strain DAOM 181602 / DAOM 197198 / MUCL 43194) TaxID=747089 RepID=A0A2P4PIL3_RHIID|nr:hypothetical protein GLOIN_2v1668671 [Rhizophagus irregularis DAOM 181602=DAOM 197198]POG65232.1 hypothetical protein GLOIN_2v1668671 [Rhizophagus irregularis DAOM 181602=DAOM 197198]|eukprot:XP_025172098.1 hypothetical protein GLOIN_2v1668671 [Rhizophagus irregularis DAOM 181602=DAOM 197198]
MHFANYLLCFIPFTFACIFYFVFSEESYIWLGNVRLHLLTSSFLFIEVESIFAKRK